MQRLSYWLNSVSNDLSTYITDQTIEESQEYYLNTYLLTQEVNRDVCPEQESNPGIKGRVTTKWAIETVHEIAIKILYA